MSIQLDLTKLYGFKIVAGNDGKIAGQTTSSKIGQKDGVKNASATASKLGGKLGEKAGLKP
ncbi:hypothetical protein [Caenimonas sp. SL110]|uniref:hypothetical protein n=1 Tax=Caenimonas sp. SL110 TaxID=1450524 RepID=UPI00065383C1|nr:hypothetical protein [Caenimonas sp. SL110]